MNQEQINYLDSDEIDIIKHVNSIYQIFNTMESQHPDEIRELIEGIQMIQGMIMKRVARKAEPNIFKMVKEKPKETLIKDIKQMMKEEQQ